MEAETKRGRGRPRGSTGAPVTVVVDAEIDKLITRRSQEKSSANEEEERWQRSVRRYYQRKEAECTWAWIRHHSHMQELHTALAEEHQQRAQSLLEGVS